MRQGYTAPFCWILIAFIKWMLITRVSTYSGRSRFSLNEYDKQRILDTHNTLRQALALGKIAGQPQAANLQEMKWDEELAYKAQKWADSGSTYHDGARHVARFPVGQNMGFKWTTRVPTNENDIRPAFDDIIKNWFDEFTKYSFSKSHHADASTGHYTQMIWADTYLVGCGYSFSDEGGKYTKYYVCNYGPSGNIINRSPYRTDGPYCQKDGMKNSQKYYGLCEHSQQPPIEDNQIQQNGGVHFKDQYRTVHQKTRYQFHFVNQNQPTPPQQKVLYHSVSLPRYNFQFYKKYYSF